MLGVHPVYRRQVKREAKSDSLVASHGHGLLLGPNLCHSDAFAGLDVVTPPRHTALPILAIVISDVIFIILMILYSTIHTTICCIDIITLLLVFSPLTQASETK